MTGKVFSDSADIYQDQARVLYEYYRQAAETIVSEEIAFENKMSDVEAQRVQIAAEKEAAHKKMIMWLAAAGVSIVLAAIHPVVALVAIGACGYMAFTSYNGEKQCVKQDAQCVEHLQALQVAKNSIRRDYRIERIGVAYVPVAQRVLSGDKSYVVDLTGEQPNMDFSLTLINQPDELKSTMDSLHERMKEMPVVEENNETETVDTSEYSTSVQDITLHDYMGGIDREVRKASYLIGDSHSVSVSMPVIPPASQRYEMLEEYATDNAGTYPVIPVFDDKPVQSSIEEFSSLGSLNQQSSEDGSGNVGFFVEVMRQLAQGVDMLTVSRTASMSQLIGYTSKIMQNVLKASFDQYSPALEAEEIERIRSATFNYADEVEDYTPFALKESSRVRYDIFTDVWIADNGSRTSMPFGMHQVDAEVLMPVIGNLMQENRVERLRIYSDIQNQKTDYLNQWHRDTDDFFGRNRTEANGLIQRMNESYAEYVESYTNYKQQSATIETMRASGNIADSEVEEAQNQAEIIQGFQVQTNQARAKQEEFTAFMGRIRDDIDASAEAFGHVEYYEASLRDFQAREHARAMQSVRDLDPRRQRLATVSPYLAEHGTVPPEPSVSERLTEDFVINLTGQVESKVRSMPSREGDGPASASLGEEVRS